MKENYIFKVPEGVQHFPWGRVQILSGQGGGGAQMLIFGKPIELVLFQGGPDLSGLIVGNFMSRLILFPIVLQ